MGLHDTHIQYMSTIQNLKIVQPNEKVAGDLGKLLDLMQFCMIRALEEFLSTSNLAFDSSNVAWVTSWVKK